MKLEQVRRTVGLTEKHDHMTFHNFQSALQPSGYEAALAFLSNRRSLVLFGDLGVGKTHLAVSIINALLPNSPYLTGIWTADDMDGVVCFITFDDALRKLRATYQEGYDGMGEGWWMERWRKVQVLVLDEVGMEGREKPSEFTKRIGYDIIDGRYRLEKPVIITTNKMPGELGQWITQAAVDRLLEMGRFVEMRGQSYRLRR